MFAGSDADRHGRRCAGGEVSAYSGVVTTERARGIGGFFFRARDPLRMLQWYAENLGIETMDGSGAGAVWQQEAGPTVFAPFPDDTSYFGRPDQTFMLNFRVADLDAMLAQLRARDVPVDDEVQVMEGIGRFGWATDPEGNRIELWEPDAPG